MFVCAVHIGLNGYYILHPQLPDIKVYEVDLKDMDFPLTFKLCATEVKNSYKRYTDLGYTNEFQFFMGKSSYNNTLYGWNGHTPNGSTVGDFEGLQISMYFNCLILNLSNDNKMYFKCILFRDSQ